MSGADGRDRMRIEYLPLDDLLRRRHPRNPKDHALEALDRSMSRFGYTMPVAIDEGTGNLAAGHGRVDGLEIRRQEGKPPPDRVEADDGTWLVPTIRGVSFASEDELLAYLLADNMLTEAGGWIPELLAEDVQELIDRLGEEDALVGTGIGAEKLDAILSWETDTGDVDEDEFDPEPPEEPDSRPGQIYELGPHRLICGDATDPETVSRLLDGAVPALTLTDPPYSVAYERSRDERGGDAAAHDAYEDPATAAEILRFLRDLPSDRLVMTYPVDRHFFTLAEEMERAGFELRKELVWVKDTFSFWPGAKFQQQHEPVLLCARKGVPLGADVPANESTVQEYARPRAHDEHATQKPMGLWSKLLRAHTSRGDLVYDPFAGSGTTLIAAEQLGRRAFVVELSPRYCDVTRRRYAGAADRPDLSP